MLHWGAFVSFYFGFPHMDFETARFNMIEQQIRPWDVLDTRVLELLRQVPREVFVAAAQRSLAFADLNLPIGHGEAMWQPKMEARVIQALAPTANDRVLEVGTGSGYLTALLASCTNQVTSIDIHSDFIGLAKERLRTQNITNVQLTEGDGARGWPSSGPWDVIVLTGSVPSLPSAYRDILTPGGRLAAVVGQEPVMETVLYIYHGNASWSTTSLFETVLQPLVNAEQPDAFVF
jgi:protein-L-isoaspartate(D-aspartate) O-methyltransferase